jgi:hypothetical protein
MLSLDTAFAGLISGKWLLLFPLVPASQSELGSNSFLLRPGFGRGIRSKPQCQQLLENATARRVAQELSNCETIVSNLLSSGSETLIDVDGHHTTVQFGGGLVPLLL